MEIAAALFADRSPAALNNLHGTCPAHRAFLSATPRKGQIMDKDRIKGSADQAKGAVKETAGKLTGDQKLKTEGKLDKAKGKVESAVGGMKDTLRNQDR
jgi:uncharacterized protein YjbJ (UPF0337 family)